MQHILLIDASGYAHRAYHTGANQFRASDGLPTWAITGFMAMVWRLLGAVQADPPTLAAAVFDAPEKTFRHKLFPEYKNNRPARDMELTVQMPYLRHAAETLGITPLEMSGYEADDVIATLATRARKAGIRATIVSSDKDFCQLVVDGQVEIVDPLSRQRVLEADVRNAKKFGVEPKLVPDVQALAGDSVDNIPGLDGIGLKTAAGLIRRFGSIEGVLKGANSRSEYLSASIRQCLKKDGGRLALYRKLATLRCRVPLKVELESLKLEPVMRSHLEDFLKLLEASNKLTEIFALDVKMDRIVAPLENPFEWWEDELIAPGQRVPELPQCGFYRRKLVKGGPWVAARIWRDPEQDYETGKPTGQDVLRCMVGTERRDPVAEWGRLCNQPIKREDYSYEIADADHAKKWRPGDPKANPRKPINLLTSPSPRNPKPLRRDQ